MERFISRCMRVAGLIRVAAILPLHLPKLTNYHPTIKINCKQFIIRDSLALGTRTWSQPKLWGWHALWAIICVQALQDAVCKPVETRKSDIAPPFFKNSV